jgi:hypothetical protein
LESKEKYITELKTSYVAVPIDVQAFITPLPVFGVGIELISTITDKKIITGGFICLQIGLLK